MGCQSKERGQRDRACAARSRGTGLSARAGSSLIRIIRGAAPRCMHTHTTRGHRRRERGYLGQYRLDKDLGLCRADFSPSPNVWERVGVRVRGQAGDECLDVQNLYPGPVSLAERRGDKTATLRLTKRYWPSWPPRRAGVALATCVAQPLWSGWKPAPPAGSHVHPPGRAIACMRIPLQAMMSANASSI